MQRELGPQQAPRWPAECQVESAQNCVITIIFVKILNIIFWSHIRLQDVKHLLIDTEVFTIQCKIDIDFFRSYV